LENKTTLRFSEMSNSSQKVYFHSLQRFWFLRNRKALKVFIESIFKKEKKALTKLDYVFCTDDYLLKINQQFLRHDYYTDIITFDLSEKSGISGEVYISIDRLKDNSGTYNTTYSNELHRLMFHGALHLMGFKDGTARETSIMKRKEDFYLSLFGDVPRGTVS
jgi:probable rRNA maturation factor